MCGIAGIFHFDTDRKVDNELLKNMTNAVSYRGPDGEGYYIQKNIGLGHRRLSILDIETGVQPMFNEDKSIALVLNGEIYNYIELKAELINKGHSFKTASDTEVVIKAYEEWGIECQNKFNGMWAFALWDNRKQHLLLSCDRLGEKPLSYAAWDNSLLFGSEMKSIFEYGVPKEPLLEFLDIFVVFKFIPSPHSFYNHIKKLQPGHYIIANADGYKEYKYWELPSINEGSMNANVTEVYQQFESLLEDAVKIRMRCDVPFGAFLSGGLDSSSIVSLMSGYSKFPVNTFTIGYDEEEFDETYLAGLVATKFKTNHRIEKVGADTFQDALARIIYHYDEPFGDSSAIPTGYVSKFAAQKVKMVLTGDGGDEALSGYPSYQGIKVAQKYRKLPKVIQHTLPKALNLASEFVTGKNRYKLNRYSNLASSSAKDFNFRLIEKRAKPDRLILGGLIIPGIKTWKAEEYVNDMMQQCSYKNEFYKQMYVDLKFNLPNDYLVKVDRMSMAYSLETRLPFLDYRLIEFMVGVDKDVKMKGMERKSILKNTVAKKLPVELLNSSKRGFRVPIREWLKNKESQSQLDSIADSTAVFNKGILNDLIKNNAEGKSDNGNLLWSLLVLNKILEE
jgi:asparagine synthase (glutamine-hydrolysing)